MPKPLPFSALLLGALVAGSVAWSQIAPPPDPTPLGYAEDRFVVRLSPPASRVAFVPVGGPSARRTTLGLAAVDRVLSDWPGAWLEPEFRGEAPPPSGSPATDFAAFYIVHLPPGASREAALSRLRSLAEVSEAHAIPFTSVTAVPNDSLWSRAYYFYQPSRRDIHAPEAWDLTKGDTSIVVAIIDTGVVPYHPDLGGTVAGSSGQFWTNWTEAGGQPGVDDDHNGYVDDIHGWDFVNLINGADAMPGEDWRDQDGDPNDFVGHGTGVAGLVGAINDNTIGVASTAWNVRLMPLRVAWASPRQQTGLVDMSYVTAAIRYATRMKADIINVSLSNLLVSEMDLAVKAALDSGIVIVVAAGNNGSPNYIGNAYADAVVVAATDSNDVVPIWSNRNSHVDLAAPGVNMATTIRARTGTDSLGLRAPGYVPDEAGTSFSAPLVSGAVALMEAVRKARGIERLTPRQAGTVLRYTADDIASQNPGNTGYGSGRLNMARAVAAASRIRASRMRARFISPGVAFRTNRGDSLLAYATEDGKLELYDAMRLDLRCSVALGSVPVAALAAADLGVGHGLGIFVTLGGQIAGYGAAGGVLPGWPVSVSSGGLIGAPALGDLDGDGSLEIVSRGTSGSLWAWTASGAPLPGFPLPLDAGAEVNAPLALSDIDGQPGVEIIVAQTNGTIHALRWNGAEVPGWPVSIADSLPAGPVVGEAAGAPVVVVSCVNAIHRISSDGVERTPTTRITPEASADPALGDLNHDGTDEVVVAGSSAAQATALSGAGGVGWQVLWNSPVLDAPLIGCLAASDTQSVVVPVGSCLRGFAGSGAELPDFLPYPDGDSRLVLLTAGSSDSLRLTQGTAPDSTMYRYEFHSGHGAGLPAWPTQRGNFARTGSRLYQPPMGEGDAIPPMAISDLRGAGPADSSASTARAGRPPRRTPPLGARDRRSVRSL